MEDDLEEIAVVVPRVAALLEGGLQARVDVTEPHFLVEETEDVVVLDVGRNHVNMGPGALLEEAVGELLEAALVHLVDLVDVLLADVAVEVDDEGLDYIRDVGGLVEGAGLGGEKVAEAVTELRAIVVRVIVAAAVVTSAIVSHGGAGRARAGGTERGERRDEGRIEGRERPRERDTLTPSQARRRKMSTTTSQSAWPRPPNPKRPPPSILEP